MLYRVALLGYLVLGTYPSAASALVIVKHLILFLFFFAVVRLIFDMSLVQHGCLWVRLLLWVCCCGQQTHCASRVLFNLFFLFSSLSLSSYSLAHSFTHTFLPFCDRLHCPCHLYILNTGNRFASLSLSLSLSISFYTAPQRVSFRCPCIFYPSQWHGLTKVFYGLVQESKSAFSQLLCPDGKMVSGCSQTCPNSNWCSLK